MEMTKNFRLRPADRDTLKRYTGVTQWQVRQVWQAADIKPHRLKTFKVSKDPPFAEKVIDVVGLYLNPPDNALVLSVDEKTQIQVSPAGIARRSSDRIQTRQQAPEVGIGPDSARQSVCASDDRYGVSVSYENGTSARACPG